MGGGTGQVKHPGVSAHSPYSSHLLLLLLLIYGIWDSAEGFSSVLTFVPHGLISISFEELFSCKVTPQVY